MADFELNTGPNLPEKTDYGIGCIGAGFIMRDIHLPAYNEAGFRPVAIASRTPEHARAAAEQNGVPKVYDTWQELLDDPEVEIVDIAYPPDQQLEIVREAASRPHVKGILAQKPVAFTLEEAVEIVKVCDEAGQEARRQPQHALRPVDAGAEDAARPGRAGDAGGRARS